MEDFGNGSTRNTSKNLVLVFDLDGTIAGKYVNFQNTNSSENDIQLNPNLLTLLQRIEEIRDSVSVFLLTNNSDIFYITMVDALITSKLYGSKLNIRRTYFDDVMSLNDSRRNSSPKKTFKDIETMLIDTDRSIEGLAERTFFFDDQEHPDLRANLPEGHYIKITPPFTQGVEDTTDYSSLRLRGGYRRKTRTKIKRKTKKSSKPSKLSKHY